VKHVLLQLMISLTLYRDLKRDKTDLNLHYFKICISSRFHQDIPRLLDAPDENIFLEKCWIIITPSRLYKKKKEY